MSKNTPIHFKNPGSHFKMRRFKVKIIVFKSIMMSLSQAPFTSDIGPEDGIDFTYIIREIRNKLMVSGITVDSHVRAYIYFYLFSHFINKENAANIDIPRRLLRSSNDRTRFTRMISNYDNSSIFPYFEKFFFPKLPKYDIDKNTNNDIMCYLKEINEKNFSIDMLREQSKLSMTDNTSYDSMIKLCSPTRNDTFCDPFMENGHIVYRYLKLQKDYIDDNINAYESDTALLGSGRVLLFLQTLKFLENIYNSNPLVENFNHKGYDIIISRLPTTIFGITHAATCDRVKDLKIRGTRFEQLALQLIMKGLNKGGRACIIVTNGLLQSTSICGVETRKYLLNNFEVEKIIELPNYENAIYFKYSGKPTTSIEYTYNFEKILYKLDIKELDENYILMRSFYKNISVKNELVEKVPTIVEKEVLKEDTVVEKVVSAKLDKNDQIIELLKEIRDLLKK